VSSPFEFTSENQERFQQILARYPNKRAAMLPTLHLAHEQQGHITTEVEEVVAELLEVPLVDVHEVLTFYTLYFQKPMGRHHLRLCMSISCWLRGSDRIKDHLRSTMGVESGAISEDGAFSWEAVPDCLGACEMAPMMQVDEDYHGPLTPERVDHILEATAQGQETPQAQPPEIPKPEPTTPQLISEHFGNSKARELEWYRKQGGYEGAQKALEMQPGDITDMVIHSNLRGLGGAGFPTGRKWSFVPQDTGKPIYLTANADESEPGTFKDRYIMEWDPHRLLEGIIICAYAVGIHTTYIYIRGEYVRPAQILQGAIEEAYREGVLGERVLGKDFQLDVHLHQGAGAYICGEETGLLESLEGKKGWPRLKPPFPAVVGLFGCPTVINNVETLSQLPKLLLKGAEWFAAISCKHHGGTRLFALSGCVKRPGVYELPLGTSLRELIYEYGGGVPGDKELKAVIPGGASAAILTKEDLDVSLDFDSLMKAGSMLGSGAVIVMDEDVCMVRACQNIMRFFSHESCGQCTPCREGTGWVYQILTRIAEGAGTLEDIDNLAELADNMSGTSICALSDGAAMSFRSYVKKFRSEFEYHILHKKCDLKEEKTTVDA